MRVNFCIKSISKKVILILKVLVKSVSKLIKYALIKIKIKILKVWYKFFKL